MKHLIILLVAFTILACNKDKPIDTVAVTLPVATNVERVEVPPPVKQSEWTTASFFSTELGGTFTVEFKPFFNDNNPNGYVIIKNFSFGNGMWEITRANEPMTYIDTIHTSLTFLAVNTSTTGYLQNSPRVLELFRTAEALAISYYETGKTNLDENTVWKYGRSMLGRTYGVPASFRLK